MFQAINDWELMMLITFGWLAFIGGPMYVTRER